MCIFFCVKVITEIQIYYENETVSPLYGRCCGAFEAGHKSDPLP